MKKFHLHFVSFFILFFISFSCFSQSRTELEKQKERTRKEIEDKQRQLDKTLEKQQATTRDLQLITTTISLRKSLISQIENEIKYTDIQILNTTRDIQLLSKELDSLRIEYSKLIRIQYLNSGKKKQLLFILSAKDFNQAYRRVLYYRNIDFSLRLKTTQIQNSSKILVSKVEDLKRIKNIKDASLKEREKEKLLLQNEQVQQQKIIVELQKKEGVLRKEIKNKKQIEKQLEAEIRKLIEEEIRKRKKNNNSKVIKADNVLSSNFKENKGKLPWPLDNATVVAEFGEHGHAILKGVKVNNNGIDLASSKQNSVKAVFTGEVSKIIRIPGTNVTVIIRHGNYLTVYQNLSEVKVKTGDKVSTGQIIGYADRSDTGAYQLHFELWDEINKQNPLNWLR
jgi:septal ring factor EnvC (AmiA/AmiB activator)